MTAQEPQANPFAGEAITQNIIASYGLTIGKLVVYTNHQVQSAQETSTPQKSGMLGPNPYQGLQAFEEKDFRRFFGRKAEIIQLYKKLRSLHENPKSTRLLPIYGPSGSGKSSLVRAGLIPVLAHPKYSLPGYAQARVAFLVPSTHPLESLAAVLVRTFTNDPLPVAKTQELVNELKRQNTSNQYDGLRRIADVLPNIASSPLVILVDQFEEVYSLCQDSEERDIFISNLLTAANEASQRVMVITNLRSDFLSETQNHPELNQLFSSQGYLVPAMTEKNLREAISKPAEQARHPLDLAMVNLLIEQSREREGTLPLLQFALTRIWDGIQKGIEPAVTLERIGGVGGALAKEAQRIYDELDNDTEREIARRVFLGLIHLGEGTPDTRRRVAIENLIAHQDEPETVKHVINRFAYRGVRLLTVSADSTNSESVEVTHEALFEHWQMLRQWLDSNRDNIRFQRRLDDAALNWDHNERPNGSLWRSPDLELLKAFHEKAAFEMTALQLEFYQAAVDAQEKEQRDKKRQRNRLIGILSAGLFISSSLGVVAFSNAQRAGTALDESESRRINAELLAQSLVTENLATSNLNLEALVNALRSARQVQLNASRISPERKIRVAASLRSILYSIHEKNRLPNGSVVALSPDGLLLATASREGRIWDKNGKLVAEISNDGNVIRDIKFSPDGKFLLSANGDGSAKLRSIDGKLINTFEGHKGPVIEVDFSPDGQTVVSADNKGVLKLWKIDGTPISEFKYFSYSFDFNDVVEFSPDGKILAFPGEDKKIVLLDINGNLKATINHQESVLNVAFSPDSKIIASATTDGSVQTWKMDGTSISKFVGHTGSVYEILFHPDGQTLASASQDGTVKLWGMDGANLYTLQRSSSFTDIQFSLDGKVLASANENNNIVLWYLESNLISTLVGHTDRIEEIQFSPDSKELVSASKDGTSRLWQVNKIPLIQIPYDGGCCSNVTLSPDGNIIAAPDKNGKISLLNSGGNSIATLESKHTSTDFRFSPDGNTLAFASADFDSDIEGSKDVELWLWQVDGKSVTKLEGHTDYISDIRFSPDGKIFASISNDGSLKFWKTDGSPIATYQVGEERGRKLSFSPNSKTIIFGVDYAFQLWNSDGKYIESFNDLEQYSYSSDGDKILLLKRDGTVEVRSSDGNILTSLEGHSDEINSAKFSPDGQAVASASDDGTVRLWNLKGETIVVFEGHSGRVNDVIFSPDGKFLVSRTDVPKATYLWDIGGRQIAVVKGYSSYLRGEKTFTTNMNNFVLYGDDSIYLGWLDGRDGSIIRDVNDLPIFEFSASGHFFANSGSNDDTVWLRELDGTPITSLHNFSSGSTLNSVNGVYFSVDDKKLIVAGYDLITILNFDLEDLVSKTCDLLRVYMTNPDISAEERALCASELNISLNNPSWQEVPNTGDPENEQYQDPALVDINGILQDGEMITYDLVSPDASYLRIETNCSKKRFREIRRGYFESDNQVNYENIEGSWTDVSEPYHQALLDFVCDLKLKEESHQPAFRRLMRINLGDRSNRSESLSGE